MNMTEPVLQTASYLQGGPAEFVAGVGMHSAFLQDALHLAGVPFGRRRRQSFTGVHLTKDHSSLPFHLVGGKTAITSQQDNRPFLMTTTAPSKTGGGEINCG